MNKIITISREFGSGGRELGKRLAQELGIAYYDREIVTAIAKRSELAEDYVGQILENRIMTYYPITVASSFAAMPPTDTLHYVNHSIYSAQNDIILELGQKSDCVIVGRCADYILEEHDPFDIFVYADMESRMARCRAKGGKDAQLSDRELQKKIQSIDKSRAQYYRFYTGRTWGDRYNYDICVNTSGRDIAALAKSLAHTIGNVTAK
ncbi:MAG: cytidylate kinase-like family protein [Oscillospiraceae bacterium]|nr:cytidylate kinase-like family protein [Oscillospiraceae bacterium]